MEAPLNNNILSYEIPILKTGKPDKRKFCGYDHIDKLNVIGEFKGWWLDTDACHTPLPDHLL